MWRLTTWSWNWWTKNERSGGKLSTIFDQWSHRCFAPKNCRSLPRKMWSWNSNQTAIWCWKASPAWCHVVLRLIDRKVFRRTWGTEKQPPLNLRGPGKNGKIVDFEARNKSSKKSNFDILLNHCKEVGNIRVVISPRLFHYVEPWTESGKLLVGEARLEAHVSPSWWVLWPSKSIMTYKPKAGETTWWTGVHCTSLYIPKLRQG